MLLLVIKFSAAIDSDKQWRSLSKLLDKDECIDEKQYQEKTGKVFNKPILNDLNNRPSENYAVHLYNEVWRRNGCNKNAIYEQGCLYEQLKQRYGVTNDGNKSGKNDDDTIIINIVGEHNGKVVVYPISSKN